MAFAVCLLVVQCAIADDCCAAENVAHADRVADTTSYPGSPTTQTSFFRSICAESSSLELCCTDAGSCRVCSCGVRHLHSIVLSIDPGPQPHTCVDLTAHRASVHPRLPCAHCKSENQMPASSRAHARLARLQL